MIGVALLALVTAFSGAVVPGPLFAITVNQALLVGWTAGVWLMVGHMIAELLVLMGIRLGLGRVLQRPAVTRGIGLVGGIMLLVFAWLTLDAVRAGGHGPERHTAALSVGLLITQGALLSLLNPYWVLWWATVGVGQIAILHDKHGPRVWPVFFIGHTLADYLWYVFIAILVAVSGHALAPAIHRGLMLACGLGIAILGVVFIVRPVRELLRTPAPPAPAD